MTGLLIWMLMLLIAGQGASVRPSQDDCIATPPTRVWRSVEAATAKTRVEPQWPVFPTLDPAGAVVLEAWIDERGDVACVKVIRSIAPYDRAAVEAVRQWKFAPATLRGTPVAVIQEVRLSPK